MAAAGALVGTMAASGGAAAGPLADKGVSAAGQGRAPGTVVPFFGAHQAGILTPLQNHTFFAAFDLVTDSRDKVAQLLRIWTEAAAQMSAGDTAPAPPSVAASPAAASGTPAGASGDYPAADAGAPPAADSGEAIGLAPARLTLTFGFGPGLFVKDGHDRFGLAARRPEALVDLPRFNGDQLIEARTGGDLSVQACADDPQVAFHAIRQISRLAYGVAQLRWAQTGFSANFAAEDTPRNLMGFKDGTQNPIARPPTETSGGLTTADPGDPETVVWAGDEAPAWMRGGSYMVARRIRISLEHWDRTDVDFQEQVIGRHKESGAPLGGRGEFDALDLDAADGDGNPVIPDDAHVRLASAARNGGAQILRRSFSYNDGLSFTAERWPPWHQGMQFDAGLLFVAYQRDPRSGFIRIYDGMSKLDALNQFTTHVGGGIFACPAGAQPGRFIGQGLFEAA